MPVKTLRILFLCLMLVFLSGCRDEPVSAEIGPLSDIPGYYALGQSLEGGVEIPNLSLRRVDMGLRNGETLISFMFEELSGGALNETPRYSVVGLDGPARLKIIAAADSYNFSGDLPERMGMLSAIYTQPAPGQDGLQEIFLQFTGNIAFRVVEERGAIILHILPADPNPRERYFAVMPHDEKTLPIARHLELEPVLCEGGEQMLYFSKPFDKLEDADALTADLNDRLDRAQYNERATVVMRSGNHAPDVMPIITREELNHLGALKKAGGSVVTADPWAVDARFLCWMPDGESALYAQPMQIAENGESYEQLWVYAADGSRARYNDAEPVSVYRALFSPDGRYLAFVERKDGNQLLYMYDDFLDMLEFPSAEGMGDFTVGLDWSENGLLYAMSGDETMYLLVYDPEPLTEEKSRIRMVEDIEGSRGSVYCAGGLVYFSDVGERKIMAVDPATGVREEYADGVAFSISPNGKYMMATYSEEEGAEVIRIKNMETDEQHEISVGLPYRDGCWSLDGETLHFLVRNEDDEEYPSLLYTAEAATGQLTLEGALASDAIHTGATANEIILVSYYEWETDDWRPISYRLKLD